jgi:inner membrane protein
MEILNPNENPNKNKPEEHAKNFLRSTTAKVIMVGVLTLVLLIPLQYVKNLIEQRSQSQRKTEDTVRKQWGDNVYIYGPVLKVPYKAYRQDEVVNKANNTVSHQTVAYTDHAYFFPEKLETNADVQSGTRRQNMYEAVVLDAKMKFTGNYLNPDLSHVGILPENIEWEKATIIMNTNNLKSIRGAIAINFNGAAYAFEPTSGENGNDTIISLETKPINLRGSLGTGEMPFSMDVSYTGSKRISIAPIGKLTETKMTSNWQTPKFGGYSQPEKEAVTDKGFTANWKITQLNRPFTQLHFGSMPDLRNYSFNVDFLIPVDEYQQNERASKYGFLVIGLTFLIFFLIQNISKISIHIFQYTMIGLALIMFYTLLISITEHSSFKLAYIIAGISVVLMITLYSISILKDRKFPMFIAAALTGLYSFIYVIIQLEDYALLAGSIGLFLILGAVMYFSRRIDWNK